MKLRTLIGAGIGLAAAVGLLFVFSQFWTSRLLERASEPATTEGQKNVPEILWLFEPPEHGAIVSSPALTGDRVYVGIIHDVGLTTYGAVYCLDRKTGKAIWKFDDDGKMQHMFSSPCLANGKVYIGDGMHENFSCKLYCLDDQSGRKLWDFATAGHVESSPCVAEDSVFFGAGDDGVFCLNAETGKERWRFQAALHVDTSPLVVDGRLYAGAGGSRRFKATEIFCLNGSTGKVVWRVPTDLPVWGSPAYGNDAVLFGLGNGRLLDPPALPEKPAGALLCVDARTGKELWRWRNSDAVFCKPALDETHVYFGARDGNGYCLDRRNGELHWQFAMHSPIVARPALVDNLVYMAASGGEVCCLRAHDGVAQWTFDVAAQAHMKTRNFSSPCVVREEAVDTRHHLLYLGTELINPAGSTAVLYSLRD